jgi:hypothetical protein
MKHVWTLVRAALLVAAVVAGCFAPAVAQMLSPNRAAAILREELGHAFGSALEPADAGPVGGRGRDLATPLVVETAPRPKANLEVAENFRFQRAEWAVQKAGTVVLAGIVVGALLGVFGHGLASSATRSTADGALTAQYERFARQGAAWFLRVRPATGGLGALLLGQTLIDRNEVEQIIPEPDSSRSTDEGLVISYDAPVAEVKVRLRPSGPGWFTYRVATGGGGSARGGGTGTGAIEMRQLVYF